MRVLVLGAGAVGSVLGGFLANAGHEVTLLGRPWHLDAVRARGLRITGLWGEHHVPAAPAYPLAGEAGRRGLTTATRPDEIPPQPAFDWILVCVKAHQTRAAAELLPRWLGPQTLVCALQNGLGNSAALSRRVPPERLALGRVIFGVAIEPGHVHVTVCADETRIGALDARVPAARVRELASALTQSGIPAGVTDQILTVLWAKVLYNCALNGLSTLLEVPYGALLERPQGCAVMRAVIEEAYRTAAAHRILLEPASAAAYGELLWTRLIPQTASHQASMLHDLRRGKPSEIEALNGAIVRLAARAGLDAPMNALVTRLIHAKERYLGITPAEATEE